MEKPMSFKILGSGNGHPEFILTNEQISEMVETSDEWITTRTGIKSRFISNGESLLDLASGAAKKALERSGVRADELDLIICSTVQSDFVTPALACMIQNELGATCPAFDINAACTGFIYALDVAKSYFDSDRARHILVVAAEQMSKHINWKDRETCVLFGDGAGAVVLGKGNGLCAIRITAKGDDKLLTIGGTTGNNPFRTGEVMDTNLHMLGKEVFKFAVNSMCRDITEVLDQAGLQMTDIKKVIPHQANMRIIRSAADKLSIRDEQIAIGIDRYGNTSSASIPILLAELFENGELQEGDKIVLSAFGGGLTSGACIIEI